jgi:hypothetical protein
MAEPKASGRRRLAKRPTRGRLPESWLLRRLGAKAEASGGAGGGRRGAEPAGRRVACSARTGEISDSPLREQHGEAGRRTHLVAAGPNRT